MVARMVAKERIASERTGRGKRATRPVPKLLKKKRDVNSLYLYYIFGV
jgi:hypothetical protein